MAVKTGIFNKYLFFILASFFSPFFLAHAASQLKYIDLMVESPELTENHLTFSIKNKGTQSIPEAGFNANVWWQVPNGENEIENQITLYIKGPFEPGDIYHFDSDRLAKWRNFVFPAPSKASILSIEIDPQNTYPDKDRRNNKTDLVRPLPDFIIEDAKISPLTGRLTFLVKNIGRASSIVKEDLRPRINFSWNKSTSSSNFLVVPRSKLEVGDFYRFDSELVAVALHKYISNPPPTSDGSIPALSIVVDSLHNFTEENEDNNTEVVSGYLPDLILENVSWGSTGMRFTVKNVGNKDIDEKVRIKVWLDKDFVFDIDGLRAGAFYDVDSNFVDKLNSYIKDPSNIGLFDASISVNYDRDFIELSDQNNNIIINKSTFEKSLREGKNNDVTNKVTISGSKMILPNNPFYLFKIVYRDLKLALTFNDIGKVNLMASIATEKLLEAKELSRKGKTEEFNIHLKSYYDDITEIDSLIAKISVENDTKAKELASNLKDKLGSLFKEVVSY